MINQFNVGGREKFELSGVAYEIVEPTDHLDLSQAYETLDALQNAIDATTEEEDLNTLQHLYDIQDEKVREYSKSYGKFSNTVLVNNINYLAKLSGLKIGYVERFLGLSPGYISRTAREGSGKRMSIDSVWKLSRFFNVNIDDFVNRLMGHDGRDKNMIEQFINQLTEMTRDGSLNWNYIQNDDEELHEKFIEAGLVEELSGDRYLYLPMKSDDVNRYWLATQPAVLSSFSDGKDLVIFPYDLNTVENYTRDYDYLLMWQEDGNWKYEIMFRTWHSETDDLVEQTTWLFKEIKKTMNEMRVTPEVRTVINEFITKGAERYPWGGNA